MIGILMYTLYDQTTGKNTPKNVGMYTSGDHFQSTLTIPNLTAGHTYYLMVTFYADGSTYESSDKFCSHTMPNRHREILCLFF